MPGVAAVRPSITLPGGDLLPRASTAGGVCDTRDPLNWGSPAGGVCGDHYPIVRITGDATLGAGAVGQGVLIVDGSLRVTAGAQFSGIVIAANEIEVVGTDARIIGVAIALDGDRAGASRVADGGVIRFARCTARRAQLGAARLERTPGRWWAELR
jgi:hypothetical protein